MRRFHSPTRIQEVGRFQSWSAYGRTHTPDILFPFAPIPNICSASPLARRTRTTATGRFPIGVGVHVPHQPPNGPPTAVRSPLTPTTSSSSTATSNSTPFTVPNMYGSLICPVAELVPGLERETNPKRWEGDDIGDVLVDRHSPARGILTHIKINDVRQVANQALPVPSATWVLPASKENTNTRPCASLANRVRRGRGFEVNAAAKRKHASSEFLPVP